MTANLILIPLPSVSHFFSAFQLANQAVSRDPRLSVTVLVITLPTPDPKLQSYLHSLHTDPSLLNHGVRFLHMPVLDTFDRSSAGPGPRFMFLYLEACRSTVKHTVEELRSSSPVPVAGFLLDIFCTPFIDVAAELGLPSYIFFPSNASMLGLLFRLQGLGVDVAEEYDLDRDPDAAVEVPGLANPVPVRVWPAIFLAKGAANIPAFAGKLRQAKGILVNTFTGLRHERDVIESMSQESQIPAIYPVGPILNLPDGEATEDPIFGWLDAQPPRSVVFLCFGSMGSFDETQVREIAAGLERSGRRFLWSLRRRSESNDAFAEPSEFEDHSSVLPEGFLERTAGKGRVIGWAPQARVLGHVAIGGFVSHCGWNSTLESLWYGVPMATWPLYAEQQLNAFLLVREMGLAAEVKMDYRLHQTTAVEAAKVEEAVNKLMEDGKLRESVKEMSDEARKALPDGGSSYVSLGRFIDNVFSNLHDQEHE